MPPKTLHEHDSYDGAAADVILADASVYVRSCITGQGAQRTSGTHSGPSRFRMTCSEHGPYHPPPPPQSDCGQCWMLYGRWRVAQDHWRKARSKGWARGGSASSKAKGRAAVRAVKQTLLAGLQLAD